MAPGASRADRAHSAPVFTPLAPATSLTARFRDELRRVLDAYGNDPRFVDREISDVEEFDVEGAMRWA